MRLVGKQTSGRIVPGRRRKERDGKRRARKARAITLGASLGEKHADLSFGIFDASEPESFPRRRLFPAGLGKSLAENFRDFIDVVSRCVMSVYRLSSGIPVRGLTHAADRPSPWASQIAIYLDIYGDN